jgi:hypothetical protein
MQMWAGWLARLSLRVMAPRAATQRNAPVFMKRARTTRVSSAKMAPNSSSSSSAASDPSLQPGHGLEASAAQRRAAIAHINRKHDIHEHPPTHQSSVTVGDISVPIRTTVLPPADLPPHHNRGQSNKDKQADSRDGPMAAFLRAAGSALRSGAASLRTVRCPLAPRGITAELS